MNIDLWKKYTTLASLFALMACSMRAEVIEVGANSLIPNPVRDRIGEGSVRIDRRTVIVAGDPEAVGLAAYLNEYLEPLLGGALEVADAPRGSANIALRAAHPTPIAEEGYRLRVAQNGISIDASDRGGLFNGIQTFLQLLPAQVYAKIPSADDRAVVIPYREIEDSPRFAYRGMMLDVARTFFTKDEVLRYVDWLSYHKINKLHWHLTDDEGWRIEILSHPELTARGGFRGGDSPVPAIYGRWNEKYGGYYTQDEIREVVAYAAFRNIEVIPEIDLPGHSRTTALVRPEILCGGPRNMAPGYDYRNVWCVSKPANYEILSDIIGELSELFPSAYLHLGGDEVMPGQWAACPDCSKLGKAPAISDHFFARLSEIAARNGKKLGAWNEAVKGGKLDKGSLVYGWEGVKACLDATAKGYRTVVMPGAFFYFDMRQSPYEVGQVWAGMVDTRKAYSFRFGEQGFAEPNMAQVAGVEAAFFGEIATSQPDPWAYLQYMSYPRICALAEVGWSDESKREWNDFYGRLVGGHLARLSAMGIGFRMFPPDVKYANGVISASPTVDSMVIYYTKESRQPAMLRNGYNAPVADSHPELYRFEGISFDAPTGVPPEILPAIQVDATVAGGSSQILEIALPDALDKSGLWNIVVYASRDGAMLDRIELKTDAGTTTIVGYAQKINPLNTFRLRATDANRHGTLRVSVNNPLTLPTDIRVELTPSPWIGPKVTLTSTLGENPRFPFSRVADYVYNTYARTNARLKNGDTFTYTFASPVACRSIEAATGLYYMPRYHVVSGYAEVSYAGSAWERVGDLEGGKIVIYPSKPVKSVRIVSTADGNGENAVALQDLKIKPLFP